MNNPVLKLWSWEMGWNECDGHVSARWKPVEKSPRTAGAAAERPGRGALSWRWGRGRPRGDVGGSGRPAGSWGSGSVSQAHFLLGASEGPRGLWQPGPAPLKSVLHAAMLQKGDTVLMSRCSSNSGHPCDARHHLLQNHPTPRLQ